MAKKPEGGASLQPFENGPEINLPGAHELREVVEEAQRQAPSVATLRHDVVAGLTATIANVPEGMALGLLAGVNPMYGLYASTVGPIAGGLLSSTRLMMISNTGAASLAAGQALSGISSGQRDDNLFLMVALAGVFAIVLGALGLGRLTRFVSYSVTTGFLAGIAAVLVLSQLPAVVGYSSEGPNQVLQTLDLLTRLDEVDVVTLGLATLTVALTAGLQRTRLRPFGGLAGIVVPTVLVVLFSLDDVAIVQDVGDIPRGFPLPALPPLTGVLSVSTGALSVALIVLVQGTAVSQSVPNPDGSESSTSRDFIAQGVANVAAGLFRGLPVGGSLSGTVLSVSSGARERWATVFSGIWMAVIVILFPGLVSQVAMPALAGLLILAGIHIVKPRDIASVWLAGWPSRLAGFATFAATLVLPIQAAVTIGVAISTALYMNRSSTDVTLVELVERPDGRIEERKPPKRLPADRPVVLDVYGHLFYAGGRTLERLLPLPERSSGHPLVILRLRGRTVLGATLEEVLSKYAEKLAAVDGRLYLTGLSEPAYERVVRMAKLHLNGPVRAYEVSPILWKSTQAAYADAEAWLVDQKKKAKKKEE